MVQTAGSGRGPWGHLGGGRVSTSTQTWPRGRPAFGMSFVRVCRHRGGPSRGPSPLAAVGAEGLSSEPPTLARAFLTARAQKLGLPGRLGRRCWSLGLDGGCGRRRHFVEGVGRDAVGGGARLGLVLPRTRASWRGRGFRGRARTMARAQRGAFLLSVRSCVYCWRLQENG